MSSKYDESVIVQNLKDAGCNEDKIVAFLMALRSEKVSDGLKLLSVHRRSLLDGLHERQKQIDCLDYLVYQLERQGRSV